MQPSLGLGWRSMGGPVAHVSVPGPAPLVAAEAALIIDGYQRTHRGSPSTFVIDGAMLIGAQYIDLLNPQYFLKLGRGRIYLPWALAIVGIN